MEYNFRKIVSRCFCTSYTRYISAWTISIRRYLRNRVKKCSARCMNDTNKSIVIDKRLLVVRLTVIDSPSRKSKFNFPKHSTTLREEFQQSAADRCCLCIRHFYQSCAKKSIDKVRVNTEAKNSASGTSRAIYSH